MVGKSILEKQGKSDANEAVLHELRARQALLCQEEFSHSYPHCWRSKTPIIFRAMDQWFIKMGDQWWTGRPRFARRPWRRLTGSLGSRMGGEPDQRGGGIAARLVHFSRQRSWGVPLPAFYDAQGGAILDARWFAKWRTWSRNKAPTSGLRNLRPNFGRS